MGTLNADLLIAITNHKEKRGFVFLGSETQKTDQSWACNNLACGFNKLCMQYVGRKMNDPEVNLRLNGAFARTSSFSPRVITWLKPAIQ